MNSLEESVFNVLVVEYGQVWDSIDEHIVEEKLKNSNIFFVAASKVFKTNPSAYNYNVLQTAMLTFQYWHQKRINTFTLEAEF